MTLLKDPTHKGILAKLHLDGPLFAGLLVLCCTGLVCPIQRQRSALGYDGRAQYTTSDCLWRYVIAGAGETSDL